MASCRHGLLSFFAVVWNCGPGDCLPLCAGACDPHCSDGGNGHRGHQWDPHQGRRGVGSCPQDQPHHLRQDRNAHPRAANGGELFAAGPYCGSEPAPQPCIGRRGRQRAPPGRLPGVLRTGAARGRRPARRSRTESQGQQPWQQALTAQVFLGMDLAGGKHGDHTRPRHLLHGHSRQEGVPGAARQSQAHAVGRGARQRRHGEVHDPIRGAGNDVRAPRSQWGAGWGLRHQRSGKARGFGGSPGAPPDGHIVSHGHGGQLEDSPGHREPSGHRARDGGGSARRQGGQGEKPAGQRSPGCHGGRWHQRFAGAGIGGSGDCHRGGHGHRVGSGRFRLDEERLGGRIDGD
mmetsp:Transcript_3208/g.19865  ORF Transcript_3208/g.19865 Transcript_3208/m.19865 type:complete len:347 (+) Transcript_3208:1934-2974(+)